MLTRLSLPLRRGTCLSRLVLSQVRPIPYRTMAHEQSPPPKKESPRSNYSSSEISDMVLRRLQFRNQHGVVRALIIGSGIVVVSSVLFLYVFRTPLKNQTVAQVADVAKSSLEQGNSIPIAQRNPIQPAPFDLFRQCQTPGESSIARAHSESPLGLEHSLESVALSRARHGRSIDQANVDSPTSASDDGRRHATVRLGVHLSDYLRRDEEARDGDSTRSTLSSRDPAEGQSRRAVHSREGIHRQ